MPPHFLLTSPEGLKFSCMSAENGLKVRVAHKEKAMFFNCKPQQLVTAWEGWKKGGPIADVLPFLDEKELRYLETGLLPEEEEAKGGS